VASLARELGPTMTAALAGVADAADPLDEIRARRDLAEAGVSNMRHLPTPPSHPRGREKRLVSEGLAPPHRDGWCILARCWH